MYKFVHSHVIVIMSERSVKRVICTRATVFVAKDIGDVDATRVRPAILAIPNADGAIVTGTDQ